MDRWQYRITVHSADEILDTLPEVVGQAPPMLFCDDEGACYFDEGPNPYTDAIAALLNEHGEEGWELVQVAFRPQQMICFWKRSL
jgi:hypothetical protein